MKYLRDSFAKFKSDALAKGFYDLIKLVFTSYILVVILKFIPIAKEKLEQSLSLTIWAILSFSLLIMAVSFTISFVLFNKKFKKIQVNNQIDELTGLKNHKALNQDLDTLESKWDAKHEPVSLILIDVDDFKKLNDNNSYEIADKVLTKLGEQLAKDSRITDEAYRYFMKGDEFLIIAKQTSAGDAQIAANRKRELIAGSTFEVDGKHFKLTVSCGVTEYRRGELKGNVLDRVSRALKLAKNKPDKNSTEILS